MGAEIPDRVTKQAVSPQERFHRFLADPVNRDENGVLRFPFSTFQPDKAYFSSAVCNDRIKSIRLNLVGDNLGADTSSVYVQLSQGGINHIRTCTGNALITYDLAESGPQRRVARIEAGINSPKPLEEGLPNTDLILRSVLSSDWELAIDQRPNVEPVNEKLQLLNVDDIEIIIEHEACTIQ